MNFNAFLEKQGFLAEAISPALIQKSFINVIDVLEKMKAMKIADPSLFTTNHVLFDQAVKNMINIILVKKEILANYPFLIRLSNKRNYRIKIREELIKKFGELISSSDVSDKLDAYSIGFTLLGKDLKATIVNAEKKAKISPDYSDDRNIKNFINSFNLLIKEKEQDLDANVTGFLSEKNKPDLSLYKMITKAEDTELKEVSLTSIA